MDNAAPARGQYPAACSRGVGPLNVYAADVNRNVPRNNLEDECSREIDRILNLWYSKFTNGERKRWNGNIFKSGECSF